MSKPALILGATGMLGSAVLAEFRELGIESVGTTRDPLNAPVERRADLKVFDVDGGDLTALVAGYGPGDFVINCVGVIKTHIRDSDSRSRRVALEVNSVFPYELAALAEAQQFRVLQIATDCVYSGSEGAYSEDHVHDPHDVYGKTKSLGEIPSNHFLNLRCSIIGLELKDKTSLLEWVLSHKPGDTFNGFTDHLWNGVSTQAFARIAAGVVRTANDLSGTFHVVPADIVSKDSLSRIILSVFDRQGITVDAIQTDHPIDRTLTTQFPDQNARLWADAGYTTIPTVEAMVADLAPAT